MTYTQTLDLLYSRLATFHHIGGAAYKPGLENTIRLMSTFDNPHTRFKSIHIAGTNGKGSVSHSLAAILQAAGYKTGLYTSPHLVDFSERIRINGNPVEEQYVIDFVESNQKVFDEIQPSFFEATMAMAFCYFADNQVDIAIIETGLGGRLDSTNVITPLMSVITNISFDHVAFLGNTLDKIAREKAGIIKAGIPVVIGEKQVEISDIFIDKANENNCLIRFADEMIEVKSTSREQGKMNVITSDNREYCSGLCGDYQLKNIATVLTVASMLPDVGLSVADSDVRKGIEFVTEMTGLQGRWQILSYHPQIVLDTAHNKAGLMYVCSQLKSCQYAKLHFVLAVVNDKDISAMLALLPADATYYFTQASIARALPADVLYQKATEYHLSGKMYPTIAEALDAATVNASTEDMIFIGGSNFTVGEALVFFNSEKKENSPR